MARSPKGVVARSLPDWNYANLYYGRADTLALASSDTPVWCGITNSLTSGQSIVLWHVEFSFSFVASNLAYPGRLATAWQYNFTNSNGGDQGGGSLSTPGATGLATIFSGAAGGGGPTPTQTNYWNTAISPTTGQYVWPHEWPYAILPPQYGIAWFAAYTATPQQAAASLHFNCVYEVVISPLN
jgi:hypothetical protein